MKSLFSIVLLASLSSWAGVNQNRKTMTCGGSPVNGVKVPFWVQAQVLNSVAIEAIIIKYKNQVLVNETSRIKSKPYSDGIINDHLVFFPKTDQELGIVLPPNFNYLNRVDGFLSIQKGDDITFTALDCVLQ